MKILYQVGVIAITIVLAAILYKFFGSLPCVYMLGAIAGMAWIGIGIKMG